jgi:hypothetical protein
MVSARAKARGSGRTMTSSVSSGEISSRSSISGAALTSSLAPGSLEPSSSVIACG